ncbi:glycosyltransferase [Coralloluteibacterium stylophorae]|uniref:Glycosyltransferase n=1 Tax=Coralloluteibacterium stylophorae TaxID=1776034 RepID=A0A8J7VSG6_9GAMM|nr:glycosyltransferase [Coralloluteibacterium stylophorae]MBS7458497.1 glycosyltransferase [Coralloluteibacterium stylophorae]
MPRRLTVVQLLPALESGGVERSTLEIAAALVAAGHRSVVVSAGGRLVAALLAAGSEHVELDIGRKSPWVLRQVPALRRVLTRLNADIVHARSRLPAWIGHLALRDARLRARFVTTVHGLNSPSRYSRIMARGERVICVSETVRAHVRAHYPDTDPARIEVIPRGIDPAAFPRDHAPPAGWRAALEATHPELAGGRLLLMPGRGTRLKGHGDAIAVLAALRAGGIDARLWLMGAGGTGREGYLEELRALARGAGVDGQLAIGPPRDDIVDAYAASDLVLQLSRKPEAFGRTVVEALAVGRPVLGWAHGGVGELLAALYPTGAAALGDMDALAARARALLEDAPAPPVTIPYSLAAMQAATLALYVRLADA